MGNFASSKNLGNGYPTPGPQRPDIQDIMNHAYFLTEGQWKEAKENNSYDYIIIGSGFCGYAFAKRILEKDKEATILMIERGGFLLPTHFQNLGASYKKLVGPISETFPWSLSQSTMLEKAPYRVTQHGMLPYFGGRSFLWSAWCPQPEKRQVAKWSKVLFNSLTEKNGEKSYFEEAADLLHVHKSNRLPFSVNLKGLDLVDSLSKLKLPEYGVLQKAIYNKFSDQKDKFNSSKDKNPTGAELMKVEYASLACGDGENKGIDFNKFSTPTAILNLVDSTAFGTAKDPITEKKRKERNNMYPNRLHIVTECVVEEILNEDNKAYGLLTTRGTIALNDAELIVATGAMPPATLIQKSFDHKLAGQHFTAHTISAITARIEKSKFLKLLGDDSISENENLQMGAIYLPFFAKNGQQFHIQLSIIHDPHPDKNKELAMRYMPDVVSTASPEQLADSEKHVILVCAILGELDIHNEDASFHANKDHDATTASVLRCNPSPKDKETWDDMGKATYDILDYLFDELQYWYSDLNYYQESLSGAYSDGELAKRYTMQNTWVKKEARTPYPHVPAMVHEGSTLPIENENGIEAVVNLNYQLINKKNPVSNLFITGASLWAQSGAWNPTLTMTAMALQLADKRIAAKEARKPINGKEKQVNDKHTEPDEVLSLIDQSRF
ncbi:choline dehydrogenase [Chryseobacterium nakagawai]|uniref:GMC family oxidoreductase n=1 Tax=Chryseobacterium nakagawai TaxID=1241982 RepID=A0AAD0YHM9_CHRNA|nr:GMC family oxidoreductase [Chryseobacterium nakagawai]AZA89204.1 GMC family oxidoreductase [Chryseobacterium nakagawai]VEH20532.1 choline dehydrogenase [Chryseobacterium nakagawai]